MVDLELTLICSHARRRPNHDHISTREDVGNTRRKKSYKRESDCPLRASGGLDIIVG
jgi:hypothetical protein